MKRNRNVRASYSRRAGRQEPRALPVTHSSHRENSLLCGRNSLREVLRHSPERIVKVFIADTKDPRDRGFQELLELVREKGIPAERTNDEQLSDLTGTDAHQGFAAALQTGQGMQLKDFLESTQQKEKSLVLLLDSVEDPQNLGAILRAAECFAADAVIWSKNRGVGLTPAGRKASVGASELVNCIEVSNLNDALLKLKQFHYWIIAAEARPEARDICNFEFPYKSAIIVGSEGRGIQELLCKNSDFMVRVPLYGKINSLNVSQAASLLLFSYTRQHLP